MEFSFFLAFFRRHLRLCGFAFAEGVAKRGYVQRVVGKNPREPIHRIPGSGLSLRHELVGWELALTPPRPAITSRSINGLMHRPLWLRGAAAQLEAPPPHLAFPPGCISHSREHTNQSPRSTKARGFLGRPTTAKADRFQLKNSKRKVQSGRSAFHFEFLAL